MQMCSEAVSRKMHSEADRREHLECLRESYDKAFRKLVLATRAVQLLNRSASDTVRLRLNSDVEEAMRQYRRKRNAYSELLASTKTH